MTDEVYVYFADLPPKIHEMVCPCDGGYNICINSRLSQAAREQAYRHAMWHIQNNDWEKDDVELIEIEAHRRE